MTVGAWRPTPAAQSKGVSFVVACNPILAETSVFEGSLAEMLRFGALKIDFRWTSRRKASKIVRFLSSED